MRAVLEIFVKFEIFLKVIVNKKVSFIISFFVNKKVSFTSKF